MNARWVTTARKRRLADLLLSASQSPLGFVDVGAGGPLKAPWTLLSPRRVRKFDFEPEDQRVGAGALCVSDHDGRARLYVARDPRSSSLHAASEVFARRFDNDAAMAAAEKDVDCTTLDSFFAGQLALVDLIDINAEGHDFHVLQGAKALLTEGAVSLIKIEVLFTEVWHGQGWFSDIDQSLRCAGYDIVGLELDFDRPVVARKIDHKGELLWGKAFYAPSARVWGKRLSGGPDADRAAVEDCVLKAIALYVLTDAVARALELVAVADDIGLLRRMTGDSLQQWITWVFRYAELEARAVELFRPLDVRGLGRAIVRLAARR